MSDEKEPIDQQKLDLCFICDTTSSMSGAISTVQKTLKKVCEDICAKGDRDLMLAAVEYKDHCDKEVFKAQQFTPSVDEVKNTIDSWQARGGEQRAVGRFFSPPSDRWRHSRSRCRRSGRCHQARVATRRCKNCSPLFGRAAARLARLFGRYTSKRMSQWPGSDENRVSCWDGTKQPKFS